MATPTLLAALTQIKTDLDVVCTCYLGHTPTCPKRIATVALSAHASEPDPAPPPAGLADRPDLVQAGAEALMHNAVSSLVGGYLVSWEGVPAAMREEYTKDSRAVLAAVDAKLKAEGP